MAFNSSVFLFLFLPLFLCVYGLVSAPTAFGLRTSSWKTPLNLCLLLASLVFYAWGQSTLVVVMLGVGVVDYCCGLGISGIGLSKPIEQLHEGGPRSRRQKAFLVLSIVTGLGVLCAFKYSGFVIENYNGLVSSLGLNGMAWVNPPQAGLPLGISFFTFQSMTYTIDVYRGKAKPTRSLVDYLCYVALFPKLTVGPIVRYVTIADELVQRSASWSLFASGAQRFIIGLAKKLFIANTIAVTTDRIFALPSQDLTSGLAWVGIIAFTLQIYFDFSAYSDMAIGLGRMIGFHIPENFDYPYASGSITEFWRRWHISLSTWFREYLYVPLGGNRTGSLNTYRNLVIVFLLCGLWHGAAWTFVAWGLVHGAFLVIERMGLGRWLVKAWRPVAHLYTLLVVMCAWVLFNSSTLPSALAFLKAMAGFGASPGPTSGIWTYATVESLMFMAIGSVLAFVRVPVLLGRIALRFSGSPRFTSPFPELALSSARTLSLIVLFLASAARLSASNFNPFIYFRF